MSDDIFAGQKVTQIFPITVGGLPDLSRRPQQLKFPYVPLFAYKGQENFTKTYNPVAIRSSNQDPVLGDEVPGDYTIEYAVFGIDSDGNTREDFYAPVPTDRVFALDSVRTDGGSTNSVVDYSSDENEISSFGLVTQGSHSPYEEDLSAFFGGDGGVTVSESTDFSFGTDDFTVEGWIKPENESFYIIRSSDDFGFNLGYNLDSDSQGLILGTKSDEVVEDPEPETVFIDLDTETEKRVEWGNKIVFTADADQIANTVPYTITGITSEELNGAPLTGFMDIPESLEAAEELVVTGGVVTDVEIDGEMYRIHTFTESGTFEVESGVSEVDYLIVGGGGGGGNINDSGGGGAGGVIYSPASFINAGTYAITVGSGGPRGVNGQDSSAFGNTAGGGIAASTTAVGPGGASGAPQSNPGGAGGGFATDGGGGGGAGSSGFAAGLEGIGPGRGGLGLFFGNEFSNNLGDNGWFASGGGGGGETGSPEKQPGGGGTGGQGTDQTDRDALPNTGGGGGGNNDASPFSNTSRNAGLGGSGIVIVRYKLPENPVISKEFLLTPKNNATVENFTFSIDKNEQTTLSTFVIVSTGVSIPEEIGLSGPETATFGDTLTYQFLYSPGILADGTDLAYTITGIDPNSIVGNTVSGTIKVYDDASFLIVKLEDFGIDSTLTLTVTLPDNSTETFSTEISNPVPSGVSATGGDVTDVEIDGETYRIHTFLTSGSFDVTSDGEIDYLVVAGGGSSSSQGGGGAGGYRNSVVGEFSGRLSIPEPTLTLSSGQYLITVGAGGTDGASGSDSILDTVISIGGGSGGTFSSPIATDGGSGGGGGGGTNDTNTDPGKNPGLGTNGQGFDGGKGYFTRSPSYQHRGGGGGGAGEEGFIASSSCGKGGDGLASSITGESTYRAGGGGGSGYTITCAGAAGLGGGGNGSLTSTPNHGQANTGGGGGGVLGVAGNATPPGGNGGSGIVIVRYKLLKENLINSDVIIAGGRSQVYTYKNSSLQDNTTVTYSISNTTSSELVGFNTSGSLTIKNGQAALSFRVAENTPRKNIVLTITAPDESIETKDITINPILKIETEEQIGVEAWNHFSVNRNGNDFKIFVNGEEKGYAAVDYDFGDKSRSIRIGADNNNSLNFEGNMADLRITVGDAIYANDYSTPSIRLPVTNQTKLLTFSRSVEGSNLFKDLSNSNHIITSNGTVLDFYESPYPFFRPYERGQNFGSIYFDRFGSYLRADDGLSSFTNATDSWTIEAWLNPIILGITTDRWLGINSKSSGANVLIIGTQTVFSDTPTSFRFNFTNLVENKWNYIAVTYNGEDLKIYVDGVLSETRTGAFPIPLSDCVLGIGAEFDSADGGNVGDFYNGYITDFRISEGVLYETNFTPPVEPLPVTANTKLLIRGDTADVWDSSDNCNVGLHNGAEINTEFTNNGEHFSIDCTGNKWMTISPTTHRINMAGADHYTLEFDFFNTAFITSTVIATYGYVTGIYGPWLFFISGSNLQFYSSSNNTSWNLANAVSLKNNMSINTWYKVKLIRNSSGYQVFINNQLVSTINHAGNFFIPTRNFITFGASVTGTQQSSIYVQNILISTTANPEPIPKIGLTTFENFISHTYPEGFFDNAEIDFKVNYLTSTLGISSSRPTVQITSPGVVQPIISYRTQTKLQFVVGPGGQITLVDTTPGNDPTLDRNPREEGDTLRRIWY